MSSGHDTQNHLPAYFGVFVALLLLTGLTVYAARIDFGAFTPYVSLGIAVVKGSLVLLYFMHLRHSRRVTWVFAGGAFLWLALLVVGVLADIGTRGWLPHGRAG
jgi:cytochrome c oxidase subunit 4